MIISFVGVQPVVCDFIVILWLISSGLITLSCSSICLQFILRYHENTWYKLTIENIYYV